MNDNIALIKYTNDQEYLLSESTSYLECFKGINLRRTEIASVVWLCQHSNGLGGAFFFEQVGFSAAKSFDLTVITYAIALIGTMSSWYTSNLFGRRTLYLTGMLALTTSFLIIGCMGATIPDNKSAIWAAGVLAMINGFIYNSTMGGVCYCLVPELASSRLRVKTTVLARTFYNAVGIPIGIISTYMLNPTAWDLGSKTAFYWFALCFCYSVYIYFRVPETRGRTFIELDRLFEAKIPARKFSETEVDIFHNY
jgi:MFS transporter, SP family, general alpha glucoside:H+ symporter